MKLKKFFAGVLAAAMMLTVGATAVLATGGGGLLIRLQPRLLILLQIPLLWIAR